MIVGFGIRRKIAGRSYHERDHQRENINVPVHSNEFEGECQDRVSTLRNQ